METRSALLARPESALGDIVEDLQRGKVIPVLGADLFSADFEGERLPLHLALARACGARLDLGDPAGITSINDVFVRHLGSGGIPEEIYETLERVGDEVRGEAPEWLVDLARIPALKLFVTTTFIDVVSGAVEKARGLRPDVRVYAKGQFDDLDPPFEKIETPVVYHLYGKLAGYPSYVASEQDALEFLSALQDKNYQPSRLFDAFRANNLLLLGCRFPDWVTRFFLRGLMGKSLLEERRSKKYLIEGELESTQPLVQFLSRFSFRTSMISTEPVEFIRLLTRTWAERYARLPAAGTAAAPATDADAPNLEGAQDAVFISYASEDGEAARAIADALERNRIPVWYDKRKLQAGVAWDSVIQQAVRSCAFFLPLVSKTSAGVREGYVRLEWNLAVERSKYFDETVPFIVPVVIDDAQLEGTHGVPRAFPSRQGSHLPGGKPDDAFLRRMVELMREYRTRSRR